MHSVTDRRTDRRMDGRIGRQQAYANSRSYCVAVRSAKNRLQLYLLARTVVTSVFRMSTLANFSFSMTLQMNAWFQFINCTVLILVRVFSRIW